VLDAEGARGSPRSSIERLSLRGLVVLKQFRGGLGRILVGRPREPQLL